MAEDDSYFRVRIPDSLKAKVEAAASESRRSMNAEIIARLEASFDQSEYDLNKVGELVDEHDSRIHDLERELEGVRASISSLYGR